MVNYSPFVLDNVFTALASAHRREMISRLSEKTYSISELAEPMGLSLPAIHKHIKVLEKAGLVRRTKIGRSNELQLEAARLAEAEAWIEQQRAYWTTQFDALERYIGELNEGADHGRNN